MESRLESKKLEAAKAAKEKKAADEKAKRDATLKVTKPKDSGLYQHAKDAERRKSIAREEVRSALLPCAPRRSTTLLTYLTAALSPPR